MTMIAMPGRPAGGSSRFKEKVWPVFKAFWRSVDPRLEELARRPDDRLLRDVGLTQADLIGETGYLWLQWTSQQPARRD